MTATSSSSSEKQLFTISQWVKLQRHASGPLHILALLERARSDTSNAWISLADPEQIIAQWEYVTSLRDRGANLPLFGVPFAVKDNIDVAGFFTTAACPDFGTERATTDSYVVARLKEHGAIVLGKTNLDQFATGLVGTRSPYGAVVNTFDSRRVSGGSSSGSAVVVSRGLVPFSLGTDTAGSGRVPAGLNNVIGLKPTRGAVSTRGVIPACRSLDCVSIFSLTLEDAELVSKLAEGFDVQEAYSRVRFENVTKRIHNGIPRNQPILAVCSNPEWFGCGEQATAYAKALEKAKRLGWKLESLDFMPLFALAGLLYDGPWIAERYAAVQKFVRSVSAKAMDPVVYGIILKAEQFSAVDVFQNEYHRKELSRQIECTFEHFDGLLVPTTPTFPTLQDVNAEPVLANSRLGTYTNFVNLMDWSAIAIPAGFRKDGLPFSITLISGTWEEPRLLRLSRQWLSDATRLLGAMNVKYQETSLEPSVTSNSMQLAVVGAHLSGYPLNDDLVSRGATLSCTTRTAECYQLFALQTGSSVQKPGLLRVQDGGQSIEVEIWNIPLTAMGSFLSTISAPLGIGTLELLDGRRVHGFICEPSGLDGAKDITNYRGWRGYVESLNTETETYK